MSIILLYDRLINKIRRTYRDYVFYKKTGNRAKLIGNINLINTNVKLGKNVSLYPDIMFFGDGKIEIGDNVTIGNGTMIYASKEAGITIGSGTMIAAQSYIIDTDHGIGLGKPIRKNPNTHAPITIGNDVWIAANCTVLKGSVIEDGAVIGAKSLVNGTIEQNAIAVGIPAKAIKFRS